MRGRVERTYENLTGAPEKQQENEKRETEQITTVTLLELIKGTHLYIWKTHILQTSSI